MLGDAITRWLVEHPSIELVDSRAPVSDSEFHCLTICSIAKRQRV